MCRHSHTPAIHGSVAGGAPLLDAIKYCEANTYVATSTSAVSSAMSRRRTTATCIKPFDSHVVRGSKGIRIKTVCKENAQNWQAKVLWMSPNVEASMTEGTTQGGCTAIRKTFISRCRGISLACAQR
eukprot:6203334-Pleurochrysis_carterae.AAC.3